MLSGKLLEAIKGNQLSHVELGNIDDLAKEEALFKQVISALLNNTSVKTVVTYDLNPLEKELLSTTLSPRSDMHIMHLRADQLSVTADGYSTFLPSTQPEVRKQEKLSDPILYKDGFNIANDFGHVMGAILLSNGRIAIAQKKGISVVNLATQQVESAVHFKYIRSISHFPDETDRMVVSYHEDAFNPGVRISIWNVTNHVLQKEEKIFYAASGFVFLPEKFISISPISLTVENIVDQTRMPQDYPSIFLKNIMPFVGDSFIAVSGDFLQQRDAQGCIQNQKMFRPLSVTALFPAGNIVTGSNQGFDIWEAGTLKFLVGNLMMSEKYQLIDIATLFDNKHFVAVYRKNEFYSAHLWEVGIDRLIYKGAVMLSNFEKIITLPDESLLAIGADKLNKKVTIQRVGLKLENTLRYQQGLRPVIQGSALGFPAVIVDLVAQFLESDSSPVVEEVKQAPVSFLVKKSLFHFRPAILKQEEGGEEKPNRSFKRKQPSSS